jgi:hypothetical protein
MTAESNCEVARSLGVVFVRSLSAAIIGCDCSDYKS